MERPKADIHQIMATFVQIWPILAKVGQTLAQMGQHWPALVDLAGLAKLGRHTAIIDRVFAKRSANFGQISANFGRHRQVLSKIGARLGELVRCLSNLAEIHRRSRNKCRATYGHMLQNFGARRDSWG